ncbi:MAG TPA: phosphatidate cytidylyltransferase [Hyphomicrobiaceae bacterium]|nr:phosphatidate cytidylyltransferase [Hyphomicrobiaceae bacterium]
MTTAPPDQPNKPQTKPPVIGADLGTRVVSALVILPVVGAIVWFGGWPFALLVAFVGTVTAWEWGHLVRGSDVDAPFVAQVATVIAAVVLAAIGQVWLAVLATLIGAILVGTLSFGRHGVLSGLGVLFAALPGVALIALREDAAHGLAAVTFVIAAVIATDTLAYFSGRIIGGPKLMPRVSPKKTWSGLLGGMTGAAIVGLVAGFLVTGASPWNLAMLGAALAVVAQAGDLAESALKRAFDAKDASALIPGHGGFMDRIDGLVTAAIAAAVLGMLLDPTNPARALLTW